MSGSGDYISREAIGIGKCNPEVFEDKGYAMGWNAAIDIIQNTPAADVRPVVTCGECIHGKGEKMDFWNEYEGIECIGGVVHRKDWFCADGAKREES